jgi:transcriptional regulator of acetoin/glycerol metabolism
MFFEKAIKLADGRVNYASERLGISKTTLIAKLKKYGISSLQIKALSHAA